MEPECSLPLLQEPIIYSFSQWDQCSSRPYSTFWRSIWILYSHLLLGLSSGSFPQIYPPKPCINLSFPTYARVPYNKFRNNVELSQKVLTVFSLIRYHIFSFHTDSCVYSNNCNYVTMLLRFSCMYKAFNPTINTQYFSCIEEYHN